MGSQVRRRSSELWEPAPSGNFEPEFGFDDFDPDYGFESNGSEPQARLGNW